MAWFQNLLADLQRALEKRFRIFKSFLDEVERSQIVCSRRHLGMFRPIGFFPYGKRALVKWFSLRIEVQKVV